MAHEYSEVIQALERRYAVTNNILEQLELVRTLGYYYNRVKQIKPSSTQIMQSKINNYDNK